MITYKSWQVEFVAFLWPYLTEKEKRRLEERLHRLRQTFENQENKARARWEKTLDRPSLRRRG